MPLFQTSNVTSRSLVTFPSCPWKKCDILREVTAGHVNCRYKTFSEKSCRSNSPSLCDQKMLLITSRLTQSLNQIAPDPKSPIRTRQLETKQLTNRPPSSAVTESSTALGYLRNIILCVVVSVTVTGIHWGCWAEHLKLGAKWDRKVEQTTDMQVITMSGCNHSYVRKLHISHHELPEMREKPSFVM